MKKFFNSLWMAASLFAVTGSAWAQTDVTLTYITNPGFESCTAITTKVAGGDNTTSSVDYEAAGWKNTSTAKWSCSAVVAYGSTVTLADVTAPDKDNAGYSGNALGVSVGWGGAVCVSVCHICKITSRNLCIESDCL